MTKQEEMIQELTAINKELQRQMREENSSQRQESKYFNVLENDMKLERMRYGVPDS